MNGKLLWSCMVTAAFLFGGCSSSEFDLIPVSGTVTFSGGAMPPAEITQISFVPVPNPESGKAGQPREAMGAILPDGSFTLRSKLGDGAVAGKYTVVLRVWKTYENRESLVPSDYEKSATTPLNAEVSSENHEFTFNVETQ